MATKTAVKRPVIAVPKNLNEAAEFLSGLAQEQRAIEAINATLNEKVQVLKTSAMEKIDPHTQHLNELFEGLFVFAQANRDLLTDNGKHKTVEVPTGTFAWRMTPPSVHLKDTEEVLKALKRMKLTQFIRVKEEPDKEAMLKDKELAESVKGVTIKQREDFVAKPSELSAEIAIDVEKLKKKVA